MSNTLTVSTLHEDCVEVKYPQSSQVTTCRPSNVAKAVSLVTKQTLVQFYQGLLGTLTVRKKMRYGRDHLAIGEPAFISETTWMIRPSMMSYALEFQILQSFRHISRTLNVYPVLRSSDEVFSMCKDERIEDLQTLFGKGCVSPFVSNEHGWTLLHVSNPTHSIFMQHISLLFSMLRPVSNQSCALGSCSSVLIQCVLTAADGM